MHFYNNGNNLECETEFTPAKITQHKTRTVHTITYNLKQIIPSQQVTSVNGIKLQFILLKIWSCIEVMFQK